MSEKVYGIFAKSKYKLQMTLKLQAPERTWSARLLSTHAQQDVSSGVDQVFLIESLTTKLSASKGFF